MKVSMSKIDGEIYLDVTLSLEELDGVQDNIIISEVAEIFGHVVNVGVLLED